MDDLRWLDATAQAEFVRGGEVRPDELVDAAPLAGVPFLVKDLFLDVAGTRSTWGSRWLSGHVATGDDELTRRYRQAGLVIVGKTNTSEFGLTGTAEPVLFGPTRNPWDVGRSPGGSSGGAAAAVAAGLVPMAHGNDLGGSLRYPAAWCGVFGLKPTRGRVPVGPGFGDVVSGLFSHHVITRSVRDSATALDAVAGPAVGDPYPAPAPPRPFTAAVGAPLRTLRVALWTRPRGGQRVAPAWSGAAERAAHLLEALGHHVDEGLPDGLDDGAYDTALGTVYTAAAGWLVERWSRAGRTPQPGDVEPATRAAWERSRGVTAGAYLLAIEHLQRIARRVAAWFERYDVWLTPTLGESAAPLGALVGTEDDPLRGSRNAATYLMFDGELANVTGNPAMSVPFGFDERGLPVAVSVLGRFGDDATLFGLAAQLEQAAPWARHRPPLAPADVSIAGAL